MKPLGNILLVVLALCIFNTGVQAGTLLDEKFPTRNRLQVVGFELTKPGEITINAAGIGSQHADELIAFGWIIDHATRKVVWEMQGQETEKSWGKKYLRKTSHDQVFSRGKYELYLFTGDDNIWFFEAGTKTVVNILSNLFSGSSRDVKEQLEDCYIRLESDDLTTTDIKTFDPTGEIPGALFKAIKLGDDDFVEQAFVIDKPMNLRMYMLIEVPSGYESPADFGWVMNADTREMVWSAAEERSQRAGGGKKNRKIDTDVLLPKGSYILTYATDDSHSYHRFNAAPPYDPLNWGVTVLPGTDFEPTAFHLTSLPSDPEPLIDMTQIGDNESYETTFQLSKEGTLHIRAIGEMDSDDEVFADYSWIESAGSGRIVWEMTGSNTEHAGGADKNRKFDGEITLPAGDYVVACTTDGSHSYGSWNSGGPWLPKGWGLAIFPGKGFDKTAFKSVSKVIDNRRSKSTSWSRRRGGSGNR